HHLLPEAYLHGFAVFRTRSQVRASFLRGEYSNTGFRSYFLWTFLLKTPLTTLVAITAAVGYVLRRREPWALRLAFILVPVGTYWGVVVASSLNIGHRHLLPIYPFLYVLGGSLGHAWTRLPARRRPLTAAATLALIVASAFFVWAP